MKYIRLYEEYDPYLERSKRAEEQQKEYYQRYKDYHNDKDNGNSEDKNLQVNKYREEVNKYREELHRPEEAEPKNKYLDDIKNLDPKDERGVSVEYLPYFRRGDNILNKIIFAVNGDERKEDYNTRFNVAPIRGRTIEERGNKLKDFLKSSYVTQLWAIKYDGEAVGFFSISNIPNNPVGANAAGFSINIDYAGKGIMTEAFKLILEEEVIKYPLYGYTSEYNNSAQKLMLRLGFEETRRFTYEGMPTIGYSLYK
jgi:predicted acetyltransferase